MARLLGYFTVLFVLSMTTPTWAAIVLDFHDPSPAGPDAGTAGETLETGAPFTVGGLTVTATPSGTSLFGDGLLANATAFGVDSNNTGTFTDVPENIQFDGAETLSLSFDKAIEILEIDLQGLVGTEVGRVTAGSFSIDLMTGVAGFNGTTDVYTPATPIELSAGTPLVFEGIAAGAAFGLETITLNVVAVPEPNSVAIWCLLAIVTVTLYRRRTRR